MMRRYTFKLYPTAVQEAALDRQRRMHCDLYNALLQQRIEAYRRQEKTLTYYDQCKEITALRNDSEIGDEWAALSSDAMAATAQRVDRAMQAFFRRAKSGAGRASGFPRFRAFRFFPGFSYKRHGSGWKMRLLRAKAGDLYLKGVAGLVKLRGRFPCEPQKIKTCELCWRDEAWWLSVVIEAAPRRVPGTEQIKIRFDLIDEFARVERANGGCAAASQEEIALHSPHDDHTPGVVTPDSQGDHRELVELACAAAGVVTPDSQGDHRKLVELACAAAGVVTPDSQGDHRDASGRRRATTGVVTPDSQGDHRSRTSRRRRLWGVVTPDSQGDRIKSERDRRFKKFSRRWWRETRRAGHITSKTARRRAYAAHIWTTRIVNAAADLTIIAPSIKQHTASPRGDARQWGASIATVSAINRHILNQAPAAAIQMLQYKAEEAGIRCDVVSDEAPAIAIGPAMVAAARKLRREARKIRRQANG